MVWEYACDSSRRVIRVSSMTVQYGFASRMDSDRTHVLRGHWDPTKVEVLARSFTPAVLHTCRASRRVALGKFQWFKPVFPWPRIQPKKRARERCYWIGVEDIIRFNYSYWKLFYEWDEDYDIPMRYYAINHINISYMKTVAFDFNFWELLMKKRDIRVKISRSGLQMPNLSQILIVVEYDRNAWYITERWIQRKRRPNMKWDNISIPIISRELEKTMVDTIQNGRVSFQTKREALRDGEKPLRIDLITEDELRSMVA